jgi:hypothetical protein
MDNDVFGQLCFYTFVDVPKIEFYEGKNSNYSTRPKRVKLATIYCRRSESAEYFLQFKSANPMVFKRLCAEFNFTETL